MQISQSQALAFHCPRWDELPTLPLYMDQVVLVLEEALPIFADGKERVLTPAMVNNYVKGKMVPAPEKKRYGQKHLASLVVVTVMKHALAMSEITALVDAMKATFGTAAAYDTFCEMLETMLRATFGGTQPLAAPQPGQAVPCALHAALTALMGKLHLQTLLAQLPAPGTKNDKNTG